jgi:hypothetical protein
MTTAGGTLTMASNGSTTHVSGDNSYAKYGPSSSYPGFTLIVGATPDAGSASIGQLIITNGDLFLDASNGKSIYYGNYQTSRGGTGTHEFYGNRFLYGNDSITGNTTVSGTITKLGTTAGYSLRLEGGTATNSGYVNFLVGGTSRGYIGNATTTDLELVAQNGAKLNFNTAGANRMTIDTAGTTNCLGNFRKSNDVNPTTTSISIFSGGASNSPYIDWTLNGIRKGYMGYATASNFDLSVENGAQLAINTNGAPRMIIAAGGLTTINNGLSVAGGEIACTNQPFVIVGAVGGASIGYGAGTNFGSGGYLFAYTSAGYSNSPGSGWASVAGRFWATLTGRYQVNFCFYWNNFAAGSRAVMLHYNGAGALLETRYCALWGAGIGSDTTQNYSTIVYMSAGNFLQFQFQSGSGTLYFGGITHTHCSFHFIC